MPKTIPFAGCFTGDDDGSDLVFLGLADDTQSTYLGGCAEAPEAIRGAYDGNCFNATTESGVDLERAVNDLGDSQPGASWDESARAYRERLEALFDAGRIPFIAGGDHAVTIPVLEALAVLGQPVHIVQVDAHPDLYPDFEGNRYSHACTGARALEMDHVATLTQLGIRTLNEVQSAVVEENADRIFIHEARELPAELPELGHIPEDALVYVTIDVDGFDPAFAPGVSHAVPGGLSSRQVLDFLQAGHWTLVGMDVVEVNPSRDVNDQTAILAARLLHEGMGYAAADEDD